MRSTRKMFYLTKFCRICVRSSGPLIDIDAEDADAVKLSDKLRYIRAKMVISEEEHCRLMCNECVQKLQVSYLFQQQCTKADEILERFLNEITSECPGSKFVNSELRVTIVPIPQGDIKVEPQDESNDSAEHSCNHDAEVDETDTPIQIDQFSADSFNFNSAISIKSKSKSPANGINPINFRRRLKQAPVRISEEYKDRIRRLRRVCPRITKQQRCMVLKSLLTKSDHNSYSSIIPVRKSRKFVLYHSRQRNQQNISHNKATKTKILKSKPEIKQKGGLSDLLGFIKCYDFGYIVQDSDIKEQCDGTVLDRLESFSRTFFYNDFHAYRETILSLANDSESSDDEDMFEPFDEEEDRLLWPECHQLNNNCHNITIKQEIDANDCSNHSEHSYKSLSDLFECSEVKVELTEVKSETDIDINEDNDPDILPSTLVQACYEDQEQQQQARPERPVLSHCRTQKINQGFQHFMNNINADLSSQSSELSDPATIVNHINRISVIPEASTSSNLTSLDLLTRLANSTRLPKDAPQTNAPIPVFGHPTSRRRGNPANSAWLAKDAPQTPIPTRPRGRPPNSTKFARDAPKTNAPIPTRCHPTSRTRGNLANNTRSAKDVPKMHSLIPPRCIPRCRTRGNPFINPQLLQQFQTQTFKCDTCDRSFKSPGFLHTHCVKMGHKYS